MTITSATSHKQYDLTIVNHKAVDCTCNDRLYRRHECKHMRAFNTQFAAEVAKAARFLAVQNEIKEIKPVVLFSEICGHRVKSNVHRHCGCMA